MFFVVEKVNQKQLKIGFIILLVGVFMAALDNGIISAALTTINSSFDVSAVSGTWGITLYTFGMAVATPIVGKLSDRYGRKRLFLIEVAIFTLGSLEDRKSTRLNSSHVSISYAVFCLKKKT